MMTVRSRQHSRQHGFTLFELVSYILVVAITVSVAYNRFADFPGAAERANFQAIMMQLKTGVNLQMMNTIASGGFQDAQALAGSNPMDLMLETPVNYLGGLALVNKESMPRRVWYFDTVNKQLVYLANNTDNLFLISEGERIPSDELRFHVRVRYKDQAAQAGWEGLVLEPVHEYVWEAVELQLPAVAVQ